MFSDCLLQIKASSYSDFLVTENMIDLVMNKQQDIDEEAYLNFLAKKVKEVNNAIRDSVSVAK